MNIRKLASVRIIDDIQPIQGKDRIVLAFIDGWSVIVQKDEYKIGDKTIFCEIDSILPAVKRFEFLRKYNFRINAMKMSGVISEGICFPMSMLPDNNYEIGEDVTDILKIMQDKKTMNKNAPPFSKKHNKGFPDINSKPSETIKGTKDGNKASGAYPLKETGHNYIPLAPLTPYSVKPKKFTVKKIPSIHLMGLMLAGLGVAGTMTSSFALLMSFLLGNDMHYAQFLFPLSSIFTALTVSVGMFVTGILKIQRNSRFKYYRRRIEDSLFFDVERLAADIDKDKKVVMRDFEKMYMYGYILDSYFHKDNKYVILDYETYRSYEYQKQGQLINDIAENDEAVQETNENTTDTQGKDEREFNEILEKGQQLLLEVNSLNQLIEGSVISKKIEQFHKITTAIFNIVRKTPNKIIDIRKVHEYYLPSIIKLLNIYVRLDSQVEETRNIIESKLQIEGVIDTLNSAFEEMLDSLFDEDALDIYSDISVINTMLTQDGLIKNDDFKINK